VSLAVNIQQQLDNKQLEKVKNLHFFGTKWDSLWDRIFKLILVKKRRILLSSNTVTLADATCPNKRACLTK